MSDNPYRSFFRELIRENMDVIVEELAKRTPKARSEKDALSVPEVAARTGLSKPTIHRRIKSGAIPTVPGLNPKRVPANFIDRMMNKTA